MKTVYIMATGPSINDFSKEQWDFLSTQTTFGFSWFFKKGWEPTCYYTGEPNSDYAQTRCLLDHYNANRWKSKLFVSEDAVTNVNIQIEHVPVKTGDWLLPFGKVKWEHSVKDPPKKFSAVWARTLSEKMLSFRGTLITVINLAHVLGYDDIVLCGVDMNNERHFYEGTTPAPFINLLKRISGYDPEKDGHSTNYKYGNTAGAKDCIRWISKEIRISCASKNSVLVKDGILEYRKVLTI